MKHREIPNQKANPLTAEQIRRAAIRQTSAAIILIGVTVLLATSGILVSGVLRETTDLSQRIESSWQLRWTEIEEFYTTRIRGFISTNQYMTDALAGNEMGRFTDIVEAKYKVFRRENPHFRNICFYDTNANVIFSCAREKQYNGTTPLDRDGFHQALASGSVTVANAIDHDGTPVVAITAPVSSGEVIIGVVQFTIGIDDLTMRVHGWTGARAATAVVPFPKDTNPAFLGEEEIANRLLKKPLGASRSFAMHHGRFYTPVTEVSLHDAGGMLLSVILFYQDSTFTLTQLIIELCMIAALTAVTGLAMKILLGRRLSVLVRRMNVLHGLLPICANCKKIRNNEGYWFQVEEYISTHSGITFSHGLCPECLREYYSDHQKE